jgi:uncharacterized protein YnzC (UPF0291/DUF896 family)
LLSGKDGAVIEKETVDRLNILAKKSKTTGLTDEELEERAALREKYLKGFRANFKAQLERIKFVDKCELVKVEKDHNQE